MKKPTLSAEEVLQRLRDDAEVESELDKGDASCRAYTDAIEEMLNDGRFEWASNTLEGIAATIEEKHFVTDTMKKTVNNIRERRGWDEVQV